MRTPDSSQISDPNRKWWIEKVVVPVFVAVLGGGGIVAIYISQREHPNQEIKPQQEQVATSTKESQLFFASSKHSAHAEKETAIAAGESVTLHWDVKSQVHGTLAIISTTTSGTTTYSDQVNPYDLRTYSPTETTDYFLTDREGPFKGTTLATIRVTVVH